MGSVAESSTISVREGDARGRPAVPARLIVAFQAHRPMQRAVCRLLADTDEVVIGRGDDGAEPRDRGDLRRLTMAVADRRMSTRHARLVKVVDRWILEDCESKNGTFVDGRRQGRVALLDGDLIELGHTVLIFRAAGAAAPDATTPDGSAPQPLPGGPSTFVPDLAATLAALARVAASPVSVILRGETGTGKEVVARALHAASGLAGPFVAVNCAALPATLVEAELFGHRRGAFTGAVDDRPGLIRSAHRGTLLLDEVGDLPLPAQAALLRVLQEREVVPVGEIRPVPVDVRVIAATHRDLDAMSARGAFRADLLARLGGLTAMLPPLRERREDLGLIIAALLPRASAPRDVTFTPAAARALFTHRWPQNVRELEKALGAAVALSAGHPIDRSHLPRPVADAKPDAPTARPLSAADSRRRAELDERLRAEAGNVAAVARALRTTRAQIHRWAKKLGIDLGAYR